MKTTTRPMTSLEQSFPLHTKRPRTRSQWLPTKPGQVIGQCSSYLCSQQRRSLGPLFALLALLGGASFGLPRAQANAPARGAAAAPALPAAVLLATSGGKPSDSALDSVIQGSIDELHVVNVVARPGMDLGAVQLALDCVAENAQCLRAVTNQHAAQVLIAPSLARTSGELVLSFLRFDSRDGKMRRATHRQTGSTLSSATLDTVPDLLRELFELPPKPKPEPEVAAPAAPSDPNLQPSAAEPPAEDAWRLPEAPMDPPSDATRVPVGPIVLGSGGALLILGGAISGMVMSSAQSRYDDKLSASRSLTRADVNAAQDDKTTGQTAGTVANVLFALGGATVIGAGIWLIVDLTRKPDQNYEHVQLSPMVGPQQLGLVLTQRGAGL